jgi:hypothetical protein
MPDHLAPLFQRAVAERWDEETISALLVVADDDKDRRARKLDHVRQLRAHLPGDMVTQSAIDDITLSIWRHRGEVPDSTQEMLVAIDQAALKG